MAKDRKDVPAEETMPPPVGEPAVIHAHETVTDETVHPAVPREPSVLEHRAAPQPPVAPGAVSEKLHPDTHPVTMHEDPAVVEQLDRIADLERQIEEEKRNERRRLVDAEKEQFKTGLDQREAELRAQLARVRGEDVVDEPHEE